MDEKKENSSPNTAANTTAASPDLSGLLSGSSGELIKHLLSTGGAVLINYLLSIKPLQDKMDTLTTKVNEQEKQIKEMEDQHHELIKQLNKKFKKQEEIQQEEPEELHGDNNDFFPIKRDKYLPSQKRRKYLDV